MSHSHAAVNYCSACFFFFTPDSSWVVVVFFFPLVLLFFRACVRANVRSLRHFRCPPERLKCTPHKDKANERHKRVSATLRGWTARHPRPKQLAGRRVNNGLDVLRNGENETFHRGRFSPAAPRRPSPCQEKRFNSRPADRLSPPLAPPRALACVHML